MTIKESIRRAHLNAVNKGFYDDFNTMLNLSLSQPIPMEYIRAIHTSNLLMLVTSEIGEAVEALRKGDKDNFKEEIADTAIRIFDLCGFLEIDLQAEILKKMEKNEKRPIRHGKKF